MTGFAANYATTPSEIHPGNPRLPTQAEVGDVMKCFSTTRRFPVIHALAANFVVCDHWFSSVPGPTFPNRLFLHGGSSAGLADSPAPAAWARGRA